MRHCPFTLKSLLKQKKMNKNGYINAHSSYLTVSMTLNFAGNNGIREKEKHCKNQPFVLVFIKTVLKSNEQV